MATDLKLLDGSVDDVKAGLSGLTVDDLAALKSAEKDGKNRSTVLKAIEAAHEALADQSGGGGVTYTADADRGDGDTASVVDAGHSAAGLAREGGDTETVAAALTTASSLDLSGPADIAPATDFEASGAPLQVTGFDPGHPAVDNDPRAHTTVDQNRIDFNDPVRTGAEIVTERMRDQLNG